MDVALGDLEEVTVGLVWSEVHSEDEVAVCGDFNLRRFNVEWIFALFSSLFINYRQQSPVYADREWELVEQCNLAVFAEGAVVREAEVYEFI